MQELLGDEGQHAGPVGVLRPQHLAHLAEQTVQLLVAVVVAALTQIAAHHLAHLRLVQVPRVLVVLRGAGGRIRRAGDRVDLRLLTEDFVGQLLRRRQHFRVMLGDQILHELLQLLAVHLQQSL